MAMATIAVIPESVYFNNAEFLKSVYLALGRIQSAALLGCAIPNK